MGFHLRKSFNLGGIRLNLSNSGLGFSTGIKGLRVGVDGKGHSYVGGGIGPLRYRQTLSAGSGVEKIKTYNTTDLPPVFKQVMPKWLKITLFVILGLPAMLIFAFYGIGLCFLDGIAAKIIGLLLFSSVFFIPYFCFWAKGEKMRDYIKKAVKAYNNGLYNEAAQLFEQAHDLIPDCLGLEYRAYLSEKVYDCYCSAEQYDKALDYAKSRYINNSRVKMTECYYKLGKWEDLINHLQKEFTADEKEEHPTAVAMLGEAFLKLNKNDIALETLLSGPVNKRKMDDELCAFRYMLGKCYEANNDIENALKQYQKVYSYDVNYEDVKDKIQELEQKDN